MKIAMSTSVQEYAQEFTEMVEAYKTMVPLIRDMDGNETRPTVTVTVVLFIFVY